MTNGNPDTTEQPQKLAADSVISKWADNVRQWLRWALGIVKNSTAWLTDLTLNRLIFIVFLVLLAFYVLPFPWLMQQFESKRDNFAIFYNPESEGAIVVDTPQLFTRERLINERLKENAWIDKQLKKVEEFLKNGQFARPNHVQMNKTIRSLTTGQNNSDEGGKEPDPNSALQLAIQQGLLNQKPLKQIEAARTYREKLSVGRYENILDDTHDLGENTLHRMNFNLHINPTRPRSDSLAVVTMTIREPRDTRLLFHHYGQLMIDTRQELEGTVRDLATDRANVFRLETPYTGLEAREEEFLGNLLSQFAELHLDEEYIPSFLASFAEETVKKNTELLLREAAKFVVELVDATTSEKLKSGLLEGQVHAVLSTEPESVALENAETSPYSTEHGNVSAKPKGEAEQLANEVEAANGGSYFLKASAKNLLSNCGRPMHMLNLAPAAFNSRSDLYIAARNERVTIKQKEFDDQSSPTLIFYPQPNAATGQSRSKPTVFDLESAFDEQMRAQFLYPCPHTHNLYSVARLRLLGLFALLAGPKFFEDTETENHSKPDILSKCIDSRKLPATLLAEILVPFSVSHLRTGTEKLPGKECEDLRTQLALINTQIRSSGTELGRVGLSFVIRDVLKSTSMDSTVRNRKLGDYFKFHIPRTCSVRQCHPIVSTYSEHSRRTTSVSDADVKTRGREEALRLFLELSCFANVRSYTVWPRSGEGQETIIAESFHRGLTGFFSDITNNFLTIEGSQNAEEFRIRETDHVYGLTDWGQFGSTADDSSNHNKSLYCSNVVSRILDKLKPTSESNLLKQAKNEIGAIASGSSFEKKWYSEILTIIREYDDNCHEDKLNSCLTLENLAWAAMKSRPQQTSFAWIVSPRNVSWSGVKAHVPMSVPLAAMISVPSWWGHLELFVDTCWIRPRDLRGSFRIESICGGLDKDGSAHARSLLLPLPSQAQDVLQRMGFFIIRAPYLDSNQQGGERIETGRKAAIRLVGKRLWKNPRVRLGQQWHDEIEVLPNMGGIIARFGCVLPSVHQIKALTSLSTEELLRFDIIRGEETKRKSHEQDTASQPQSRQSRQSGDKSRFEEDRRVEVWTSEGVTQSTHVKVIPFRPRYFQGGEHERPCWLEGTVAGSQDIDRAPSGG